MAKLIDSRTNLEGIIYAYLTEDGELVISTSHGNDAPQKHLTYTEEVRISAEGVSKLRDMLNVCDCQDPLYMELTGACKKCQICGCGCGNCSCGDGMS